jgi:hypothetical protein
VFLKKIDSDGYEVSCYTYKHNDFPFNEYGSDLIQLQDEGFLIIGRTRNFNQLNDMDCQIIRTTSNGDTLWTKRFGDSSNDWLDHFISFKENEFVLQGSSGFPNEDQKSILIRINSDGQILDSIRTEEFQMMLYSPLNFYIKVQRKDQDHINFTKIEPENLFN